MNIGAHKLLIFAIILVGLCLANAQLTRNYYASTCPNVEQIVRQVVQKKINQTFVTIPAVLRLYFHDCFVDGCDASVMIQSTATNKAEKDHDDNISLAGDGFDTVIKAKQAIDATPGCKNVVSCADILAIATRDVVNLAGGIYWQVELGRLDGLVSTASSVTGKLPHPTDNVDRLNNLFIANNLTQNDMVALSGAHSVGFAHCSKFMNRIYNFSPTNSVDPTLDPKYAQQLQQMCPPNVDPRIAINMDPITPTKFDIWYYKNLIMKKGLFTSDQVLYTDYRTRELVENWSNNTYGFKNSFALSMIKLGRVGVKTVANGKPGNIRVRCDAFN